jgi:hypothetical protein
MTQLEDIDVSLPDRRVASQARNPDVELERVKYGACLVGGAFVLLGVVFGIAVWRFSAARDVTAAVGSVAAVIGTIVGAFFGIHIGSSAKETAEAGRAHAEAGRAHAENIARAALGKLNPATADEVLKKVP